MENYYQNKKVLITGGLGFIGSNLASALVDLNAEVTIIDSLDPELGGNEFNIQTIKDKVKVHIFDMADEKKLASAVEHQEIIFNLAGSVSHIDSMNNPLMDLAVNCTNHVKLLECLRRQQNKAHIILTSTRQIYGKPLKLPLTENHPINPTDVNGINKYAGEAYHQLYHNVYQLPVTILRLTNTYGPRQLMKHGRQGFIPWFIRQIIEGKEITIFGDGQQVRDINYVTDVVDALLCCGKNITSQGKIYNLGGTPISLENLTKSMLSIHGSGEYKLIPFPEEKKKIDIGDAYSDYTRIKTELGWEPKVDLATGLKETFNFYIKNKQYYW